MENIAYKVEIALYKYLIFVIFINHSHVVDTSTRAGFYLSMFVLVERAGRRVHSKMVRQGFIFSRTFDLRYLLFFFCFYFFTCTPSGGENNCVHHF